MPATSDSKYMRELFRKGALGKTDTWPNRSVAYDDLRLNPAYKGWNPDTMRSFVVCSSRLLLIYNLRSSFFVYDRRTLYVLTLAVHRVP